MQAILLAAGVGRRLASLAGEMPKCLLRFDDRSLLLRHLDNLEACGVEHLTVVLGHLAHLVTAELAGYRGGLEIETALNPAYRRGSILSLHVGLRQLPPGRDALIMDADVLYHPDVLRRLVEAPFENGFLLDPRSEAAGEEMMLGVKDGRVLTISRNIGNNWDLVGEGVGFFKLTARDTNVLLDAIESRIDRGDLDADYESAIDAFLKRRRADYVTVGDLPWTEIDFDADVEQAQKVILPAIRNGGFGRTSVAV